jgi:hypothetical protein
MFRDKLLEFKSFVGVKIGGVPGGVEVEGDGVGDEFVGESVRLWGVGFKEIEKLGVVLGIVVDNYLGREDFSRPAVDKEKQETNQRSYTKKDDDSVRRKFRVISDTQIRKNQAGNKKWLARIGDDVDEAALVFVDRVYPSVFSKSVYLRGNDGVGVEGGSGSDDGLDGVVFDEVADVAGGDAVGFVEDDSDNVLFEAVLWHSGFGAQVRDALGDVVVFEFGFDVASFDKVEDSGKRV